MATGDIAPVSNPLLTGPGLTSLADIFLGKTTKSTDTSSESISPEGTAALVKQALEGSNGLAAVSGGQKAAGMYNSSTNSLLTNDLISRVTGEIAARNKTTTNSKTVQQKPQANPLVSAATAMGLQMGGKELMGTAGKGIKSAIDGIKLKSNISDAVNTGAAADDGTTEGINSVINGGGASDIGDAAAASDIGNLGSGAAEIAGDSVGTDIGAGIGASVGAADTAGMFATGADTLDASLVGGVGADGLAIGAGDAAAGALATGEGAALADGLGTAVVADGAAEFGIGDLLMALFLSKGGMVQKPGAKPNGYKGGGQITGPGTGTSDSVPVMASTGEYMLPAAVTQAVGKDNLDQFVHMLTGQKPVGAK